MVMLVVKGSGSGCSSGSGSGSGSGSSSSSSSSSSSVSSGLFQKLSNKRPQLKFLKRPRPPFRAQNKF